MVRLSLPLAFVVSLAASVSASPAPGNHGSHHALAQRETQRRGHVAHITHDVDRIRDRYAQNFKNYEKNTGEVHRLATREVSSESKRDVATEDIVFHTNPRHNSVQVQVGTPAVSMEMIIDIGTSDTVISVGKYQASKSSTAVKTQNKFQSNAKSGTVYMETVSAAGHVATKQAIAVIANPSSNAIADGALGLGFPDVGSIKGVPFCVALQNQGKIAEAVVGLGLYRSGGSLTLGGIDQSQYTGKLTYTSVNTTEGLWTTEAKLNGIAISSAVYDTTSPLIYGPKRAVAALWQSLGMDDCYIDDGGNYYATFNKAQTPKNVAFTVGGVTYKISPETLAWASDDSESDYVYGGIVGVPDMGNHWTVGGVFLQEVYVVLDYDKARIGFAPKA